MMIETKTNEITVEFIMAEMRRYNRMAVPRQISLMKLICDFLRDNYEFDWLRCDIHERVGYNLPTSSINSAILTLERLNIIKITRMQGKRDSYQLTTWGSSHKDR